MCYEDTCTVYPKKYAHGFCFAVLCCGYTLTDFPISIRLTSLLTIAPVPAKQPWWIWINTSCEFIMNDCITTTKQSTTKPCAYFLGYTVCVLFSYGWPIGDRVLSSSFQMINENAKLVYRQNALKHDIWKMSTIQFRAPYVNSLRPSDTYMSAPSHYLRQCWNILDWTLRNKLHWNFNRSWNFLFKKMHLKMSSGKWRPFCLGLNAFKDILEPPRPSWWRALFR